MLDIIINDYNQNPNYTLIFNMVLKGFIYDECGLIAAMRLLWGVIYNYRKGMEKEPLVTSNKSCKTYFLIEGSKVYFTGDFDSGNLERA